MLVDKKDSKQITTISLPAITIGASSLFVISGPCSIESKEQIFACAEAASRAGTKGLRGGAYKGRSSPYSFQGLGEKALVLLKEASTAFNLVSVSEVLDAKELPMMLDYVDILQVGSRNMHNFSLLKALSQVNKPILLKRGFAATYKEFLLSAEYILQGGNPNVILCERGIRTFESYTRNCLDLAAVPALKELTHLPIIVDPSHGTGRRSLVEKMALASIAAGCDGLMIETHPEPDLALSDKEQTIDLKSFISLMEKVDLLKGALL